MLFLREDGFFFKLLSFNFQVTLQHHFSSYDHFMPSCSQFLLCFFGGGGWMLSTLVHRVTFCILGEGSLVNFLFIRLRFVSGIKSNAQ